MKTIALHDLRFRLRISASEVRERVYAVAQEIRTALVDTEPVFVVVLNGAMFFAVDLLRALDMRSTMVTLQASSYGSGTTSSGAVEILGTLPNVHNKHVVIVEDIVDTGATLYHIHQALMRQQPQSISVAAVVNKPGAHKHDVRVDYCCFQMDAEFLVGYGLDYAEHGRELTDIYERIPDDEVSVLHETIMRA